MLNVEIYKGCRESEGPVYRPEKELVNHGNKGGFRFPWYQRDLIFIMLNMNLPLAEVAKGAGVHPKTIRKFMKQYEIERDFNRVNRVSLEITRNSTIKRYLSRPYKNNYYEYTATARELTRCILSRWSCSIDPKGLLSNSKYCLDHRISIDNAFYTYGKPLSLELICPPKNLKVLTKLENGVKGNQSSLTLDQLRVKIEKADKLYNPFVDFPLPGKAFDD